MPHAFNSLFQTGTNPCINKAIHMLLMQQFDTLNALVRGQYILLKFICLLSFIHGLAIEHKY